ncbi:thioesterase II family protein [Catellatospora methionotrophica]|uniref:thioesterase II family protein n=1 Tax=Catellatospora methionotrophica TaxID=121620 RepID=UPI0033D84805
MIDTSIERGAAWLRVFAPVPGARRRLICLPHAGGAAGFFRTWPARLPVDTELVAVRYPGRQDRLHEACVSHMDDLADLITEALEPLLDRPLSLFGHSMGASVAYEVARRLEQRHGFRPDRLFASGREAPHRTRDIDPASRTDEVLIDEMHGLTDTDRAALADPELRELILPALRSDYALIDAYRPANPPPVSTPITAYTGISDPGCALPAVRAWADLTTTDFDLRVFPGAHFFLVPAEPELLTDITRRLR